MRIQNDHDLTKLNTFGVSARAKFFVEINKEEEINELFGFLEFKDHNRLFLGGGSNVLFTTDYDGIVILNKIKGIEVVSETETDVFLKSMSGELWHDLVSFVVERGWWGVENLAYIPGTVGGAPMQNIGAYGAELKNILESVEAYDVESGGKKVFTREECELGYRDSIFKNNLKDKYFITSITLKLSKIENKNLSYKILQNYLSENNLEVKNSRDVSIIVTAIRKSKLPDPKVIGNVGSFFKNIFVEPEKLKKLQKSWPDIPFFMENSVVKIPAGWLVEQCGFRGQRFGNVGVHDKQALVLVNYGGATGGEIKDLAMQIISAVQVKFDLKLDPEVNLI